MVSVVSICSIATCIITVLTFFFARIKDAKASGEVVGNLSSMDNTLKEVKLSIQEISIWKQSTTVHLQNHDNRLDELFEQLMDIKADLCELKSRSHE